MILPLLVLAAALAALVLGAVALVRGAAALARHWGVPDLLVGMTLVAFGTSLPELALNVTAAARGAADVAFGNVVGSNIANVGLILGAAALLRPLQVHAGLVVREIPMMILASAAALVIGIDLGRDGAARALDRSDGLVLLLFFAVFLYYTMAELVRGREPDSFVAEATEVASHVRRRSLLRAVVFCAGGLVLMVAGGRAAVGAAVDLAAGLGVPTAVVALTLVAVGTSLPELSTSLVATFRGQHDLAVGNVVGSNIFNLLFILGVTAVTHPVSVPARGFIDLAVMTGLAVLLLPMALTRYRIARAEGAVLLAAFVVYVAWRFAAG